MVAFTAAAAAGIGFEQLNFRSKALTGKNKYRAITPQFSGEWQWQLKTTYT
jgi:hypothetical protein